MARNNVRGRRRRHFAMGSQTTSPASEQRVERTENIRSEENQVIWVDPQMEETWELNVKTVTILRND